MEQTNQKTVINAPLESAWNAVSDLHVIDWSKNVIRRLEKVGDAGGKEIDAKRILNNAFHETLKTLDETNQIFSDSDEAAHDSCHAISPALLVDMKANLR